MSHEMLVHFRNVSIRLHNHELLKHLSFAVHRGELAAVLGPNGCGKTTILNIIMSRFRGDSNALKNEGFKVNGRVVLASGTDVIHLPQSISAVTGTRLEELNSQPRLLALRARLCSEFGLDPGTDGRRVMSDGERQKRALVNTLLTDADLYLLDEPTNYLDLTGITALEHHLEKLKRQKRGIILVTHDRTLVDDLAGRTILITKDGIFRANGGSDMVRSLRDADYQSRTKKAGEIRKKIRQLQADMIAKAGWAALKEKQKIGAGGAKGHISRLSMKLAKRAKAAQRRAEKEIGRLEDTKPFAPKKLNLSFPQYEIRNRDVFSIKNVSFDYSTRRETPLLKDITLFGTTREKTCLMGTNGAGKSTLFKLILKHLKPLSGESHLNETVKIAYVPQGLAGFFGGGSLLDNFDNCDCDETIIRRYLGAALLRGDKVREPITRFSRGELMRAAIVKCLLSRAEFLFLDEPTSHLDIESIEILERMLGDFGGGILMISHDREFVKNVADRLYLLDRGELRLI